MNKNNEVRKFPLCGHEVCFYRNILEYNDFRGNFMELCKERREEFKLFYSEKVTSFKTLYEASIPKFIITAREAVSFSVFVLMEYGIDDIDEETFFDMVGGEEGLGIRMILDQFLELNEQVKDAQTSINDYRTAQRSGRSYWQGGGFGIRGAISGAIKAGAMNLVTDAVRGIGDSVVDSRDRSKIAALKQKIADDPTMIENFTITLRGAYFACLAKTTEILLDSGILKPVLSSTTDLKPRINNYMSRKDKETVLPLLLEAIQKDPYDVNYYFKLYQIADKDKESILKLARFFDIDEEYIELVDDFESKI